MDLKKLLTSSFIYVVIGALPLASAFFLMPFYIQFLSVSGFGVLALYMSFTALVQIVINFGMDTFIGVTYIENKNNSDYLKAQIGSIVGFLLLVGLGFLLLFSVFGNSFFDLIFKNNQMQFFPFGILCVFTAFFNSFFKTYSNLLINQQRPIAFMWSNVANFIATIAFSLTGILLYPYTMVGPIWGRFLSGVIIFFIALYSFRSEFRIQFHFNDYLKKALVFSLPILVVSTLTWLISNIDKYIIDYFINTSELAIFDFAIKCTLLVEFLLMGLGNVIMPRVFELLNNEKTNASSPDINRYFSSFTAICMISIPFITFIIPLIIPFVVFKPEYDQSMLFISILSIGFVSHVLYSYFLAPIYFLKKTKVLPKVFIYSAVLQIIITLVLIKYWGLWGAVAANVFAKIIKNVFLYFESRKYFTFKFNVTKLVYLPLIILGIIITSDFFIKSSNIHYIHLMQFIASTTFVLVFYWKELMEFSKQIPIVKFISKKAESPTS